jgi:hypothetical protein
MRLILDDLAPADTWLARCTEHLAAALIATAPRGADVGGFVSALPVPDLDRVRAALPGLRELHVSPLARRELAAAWQHGFTRLPGSGVTHAPSLLAPLRRHDRLASPGDQIVVSIHEALAWTAPDRVSSRSASWTRAMAKRAERYADAVVVPTHAVAAELSEVLDLGERVRVIGGAPTLAAPSDAAARRRRLKVPSRYVVAAVNAADPVDPAALAELERGLGDLPLVPLPDAAADRAAVLAGARLVLDPGLGGGVGATVLDALGLGVPVVARAAGSAAELAADAVVVVDAGDDLAAAARDLDVDDERREHLAVAATDRARAFSWRDAAEKVWQLHADL